MTASVDSGRSVEWYEILGIVASALLGFAGVVWGGVVSLRTKLLDVESTRAQITAENDRTEIGDLRRQLESYQAATREELLELREKYAASQLTIARLEGAVKVADHKVALLEEMNALLQNQNRILLDGNRDVRTETHREYEALRETVLALRYQLETLEERSEARES